MNAEKFPFPFCDSNEKTREKLKKHITNSHMTNAIVDHQSPDQPVTAAAVQNIMVEVVEGAS